MGEITLPAAGPVYVDTSAFIYRVEQIEPFLSAMRPPWDAVNAGTIEIVTSELTLLETLVKPIETANKPLADLYRAILLGTLGITAIPVDRSVLETSAQLRATSRVKTPDAIHAATALLTKASTFVTNDPFFRRVLGLNVTLPSEL